MREYKEGNRTLFITESILREERKSLGTLKEISEAKFANYLIDTAYQRFGIADKNSLEAYCKKELELERELQTGILYAHGSFSFGEWRYHDPFPFRTIQSWADKNDEKYDILICQVCNPGNKGKLSLKKSAVVYTMDELSIWGTILGNKHKLSIPGKKELIFGNGFFSLPREDVADCLSQK